MDASNVLFVRLLFTIVTGLFKHGAWYLGIFVFLSGPGSVFVQLGVG